MAILIALLALCLATSSGAQPISAESAEYHDLDAGELVAEGNVEVLSHLVALKEVDPNRRTRTGSTLLCVAVEQGNSEIAALLLQAGANVETRDSKTGHTPLCIAALAKNTEIAKLLLSYGVSPDDRSASGRSPRIIANEEKDVELLKVIEVFDQSGAAAFEDPPGTWLAFSEGNHRYYQNALTQESRWAMPPSCAWNRQKNQDGLFVYFNNVTGQVTWVQPDALAWKFIVHAEREQPMWLNFKRNHLQAEVPGELPDNLVDELMDEGATYWWNANTGEKAWATPKEVSWRKVVDDRGGIFWFNSATGVAEWDEPVDVAWKQEYSEKEKAMYYWNEYTGEATFGTPDKLAWSLKQEL